MNHIMLYDILIFNFWIVCLFPFKLHFKILYFKDFSKLNRASKRHHFVLHTDRKKKLNQVK